MSRLYLVLFLISVSAVCSAETGMISIFRSGPYQITVPDLTAEIAISISVSSPANCSVLSVSEYNKLVRGEPYLTSDNCTDVTKCELKSAEIESNTVFVMIEPYTNSSISGTIQYTTSESVQIGLIMSLIFGSIFSVFVVSLVVFLICQPICRSRTETAEVDSYTKM